jgi:flagellin
MGYLETGMRVLDSASALLSRLQELAVLGANDTNTTADHEAINLEAEAIGDEFNRLMTTSSYKGRDVFNTTAGSLYVSMGGRDQEMTFGIGKIDYTALYGTERTILAATTTPAVDGPNKGAAFHLAHLPSDASVTKDYGKSTATKDTAGSATLATGKSYVVSSLDRSATGAISTDVSLTTAADTDASRVSAGGTQADGSTFTSAGQSLSVGYVVKMTGNVTFTDAKYQFREVVEGEHAFKAGDSYTIRSLGTSNGNTATANSDAAYIMGATSVSGGTLEVGQKFTVDANVTAVNLARLNALSSDMTFSGGSNTLTQDIEAIQGLVNTARVQAGSQYAAIESAVNYTTDLTAQYELGYNTVNDVNFSMETAHLAKNQILQQAATAMLAQANQGQQGLLQLIS